MSDEAAEHRHRLLVQRVLRLMDGKPVDETMTAMQTVVGHILCDVSDSEDQAIRGFEAWSADVRELISRVSARHHRRAN
ncbi:hypothetical protein [Enterovirga sp. CN4-39]|uniref:hypothetical protein n=1 Tax=Enterovirga sp. CN4-39 TaxID=3400910 RepID=UPI003C0CBE19